MTLTVPAAAEIGDSLERVGTPSLLIDLDVFDANLQAMADLVSVQGVRLRPHAKAHKTSAIARRQVAAGAVGICCQKLSEAYPFAAAGIESIHISNEFVGEDKLRMATALAAVTRLSVCVDAVSQIAALAAAAEHAGVFITVFAEVDIGQQRCGVRSAPALLRLVDAILPMSHLHFGGIQAYHGGIQHLRDWSERKRGAQRAAEQAASFVAALRARGIDCPVVTGGGTGSVEFDIRSGVFNEVQPGSYLFLDGDYQENDWAGAPRPGNSLFLLSTIMSAPTAEQAVCDVGLKSLAVDSGLPRSLSYLPGASGPALRYTAANDEHGMLTVESGGESDGEPLEGRRIMLVPGHCDPTVNLHDEFICYRGERVQAIWPIDARGLSR